MRPVFPSTSLRTDLSAVKREASRTETIVTDVGGARYMFASEQVLADTLKREEEQAAYAERMARGIRRARSGIRQGEYEVGAEAAIAEAERRRTSHG